MENGTLQPLPRSPKGLSSRGEDHGVWRVLTLENMQVVSEYVLTPKMSFFHSKLLLDNSGSYT